MQGLVSELATMVHCIVTFTIEIEREADGPGRRADARLEPLGMERPHATVDVRPARPRSERGDLRPERAEEARSDAVRRAVRAVEDDPAESPRQRPSASLA